MRNVVLIVAGLALASPAWGQEGKSPVVEVRKTAKPHDRLAGFELVKAGDGRWWWRREVGDDGLGRHTWTYYATQTQYGANTDPPLAVIAPTPDGQFGVDEAAMRGRVRRVGTTAVAELLPEASRPPAKPAPAPEPEATESDPIALFCRRYHLPVQAVYAALGGGGGILGVLLALALRRLVAR